MSSATKVEPLVLKPLADGLMSPTVVANRVFVSSGKPQEEEQEAAPSYSEADLKTSEREGYQKGFIEGIKEGRQQAENAQTEVNRQISAMADQFSAGVMPLFEAYQAMAARMAEEMPKVALAIAKKVAGEALEENAVKQVSEIATRCCEAMLTEPQLTITAHESLGDTLEKNLKALAERLPEKMHIVIVRDPEMAKPDCRIEWKMGSMTHSTQEMWDRVEKAVHNMSVIAQRDNAQAMEELKTAVAGENKTEDENKSDKQE